MTSDVGKSVLVDVIVRRVLEVIAPADPAVQARVTTRPRGGDHEGGSGLEIAAAASTLLPAVTFVCGAVANALMEGVSDAIKGRATSTVDRFLDRLTKRDRKPDRIVIKSSWTRDDLIRIREVAAREGEAFGLERAEAQLIADALVGVLATEAVA